MVQTAFSRQRTFARASLGALAPLERRGSAITPAMTPAMTPAGTGAKNAQSRPVAAREPVLNSHADPEPPKDLPAARLLSGSSCPPGKQAHLTVSAAPLKANLPVYRFGVRSALALCDCVGIPEGNSECPDGDNMPANNADPRSSVSSLE